MSEDARSVDGLRLMVDQTKCIGSGMCEMLEEATFLIDEDTNIAGVIGAGIVPADRAAIVMDRCPSGAIIPAASAPSTASEASEEE